MGGGVNADPVVLDGEDDRPVKGGQLNSHVARCCVMRDIRQRFTQHGDQVIGDRGVDGRVEGAIEREFRFKAQGSRCLTSRFQNPSSHACRAPCSGLFQPEEHGSYLADGDIQLLDCGSDTFPGSGIGHCLDASLERQAGGEEALNHRVVKIAGDPVAFFKHGHPR